MPLGISTLKNQTRSSVYNRGSQPGVHVPLGVDLPVRMGTFEVSNRNEIYIYIFLFPNIYI